MDGRGYSIDYDEFLDQWQSQFGWDRRPLFDVIAKMHESDGSIYLNSFVNQLQKIDDKSVFMTALAFQITRYFKLTWYGNICQILYFFRKPEMWDQLAVVDIQRDGLEDLFRSFADRVDPNGSPHTNRPPEDEINRGSTTQANLKSVSNPFYIYRDVFGSILNEWHGNPNDLSEIDSINCICNALIRDEGKNGSISIHNYLNNGDLNANPNQTKCPSVHTIWSFMTDPFFISLPSLEIIDSV